MLLSSFNSSETSVIAEKLVASLCSHLLNLNKLNFTFFTEASDINDLILLHEIVIDSGTAGPPLLISTERRELRRN